MAVQNFEKYFLHFPGFSRENDFFKFWDRAQGDMKKIPIKPEFHENQKKSSERFTAYHISYLGFQKSPETCELLVPRKKKKPLAVIHFHDYNSKFRYRQDTLDPGLAHLFVTLRGHGNLPAKEEKGEKEVRSPGYMVENIMDAETYYVKGAYLDAHRSIDLLRLNPDLDCSRIGIMGKGFGASVAVFCASYSERVAAMVLESPSFCYLDLSQNISTSEMTLEINEFIGSRAAKKKEVKSRLSYFDGINFSDMVKCPVMVTVGLKDTIAPPQCSFALFNRLETEKTVEVYPEEGNSAGGAAQHKKSVAWMSRSLGRAFRQE